MQRRCQREKKREEAGLECNQAPDREAPWEAAVKLTPAAQVDAGSQHQRSDDPGIERPRLKHSRKHRLVNATFYFKLWSVAHKLAARSAGVMDYWSDAFGTQYSSTPILQHSIFWLLSTARRRRNCRVAGGGHIRGAQRLHASHESRYLFRRQVPAKRRHVAAALNYLPDQLVAGKTRGHTIQRWAAQAAFATQAVAIPALLILQHQRALQLQRRTSVHILHRCGNAAPGFHVGTPRGECSQVRQRTECQQHENHPQHGHGPPASAF